ncbi:PE-PPE domain-containing protein [Gordonia sp. CPCC 206044]|uniref:PE-PPE domain-containing protein n=1 Tax=Gordonia sp. CPCC 206044 TaxID=3140793 RepID=UPI003AF3DCE8
MKGATEPAGNATMTLLAVGGTGESFLGDRRPNVSGLLSAVTSRLDERFDCRWVGYPASYGPAPRLGGMSYLRSVAIGTDELHAALQRTTGPVALIGYSQGAVVIRSALHDLSVMGAEVLQRITAVGFVADPHQPPGVVPGCVGGGVAGPGLALPSDLPVFWVGASDDAICNAGADSYLRDIADLTAGMTLGRVREWYTYLWQVLRHNAFQNATRTRVGLGQMMRDIVRLRSASGEVRGYLPGVIAWHGLRIRNRRGGRHTAYAREPYRRGSVTDPDSTGCEALASWLQVRATFSEVGPRVDPVEGDLVA